MLHQVVFENFWGGIKVSAYTDLYAYDPESASLLLISLAGTDQAVKAISSAIIGCKTVSIRSEHNQEVLVSGHPLTHFRVLSTKLPGGVIHQVVADTRFFGNEGAQARLVSIPQGEDISGVVYSQILAHLASPIIREWSVWICKQLKKPDRLREMDGTLKVVEISANEAAVDEIISKGVRTGRISLDGTGGTYAGIH